jgi:hypothetical protein
MISDSTVRRIQKECNDVCFRCGSGKQLEIHHGVYADKKRFSDFLDMPENLVLLCHKCNAEQGKGLSQSWFYRCIVYSWKLEHGYNMETWNTITNPMKVKDRFIYIGSDKRFKDKQ